MIVLFCSGSSARGRGVRSSRSTHMAHGTAAAVLLLEVLLLVAVVPPLLLPLPLLLLLLLVVVLHDYIMAVRTRSCGSSRRGSTVVLLYVLASKFEVVVH